MSTLSRSVGGEAPESPPPLQSEASRILKQLLGLLTEEKAALEVLDRDKIESLAEAKLKLDGQLHEAVAVSPLQAEDRPLLEAVRGEALANQLLLVHARSCVQGVMALFAPKANPAYRGGCRAPGSHASNPPPMALNMRR